MRIERARVQNFRSIVDSRVVPIEDTVTLFVGKNEQGKTNFLRGLYFFDVSQSHTRNDFPQHLRPRLSETPLHAIPITTLWLRLGEEDVDALPQALGKASPDYILVTTKHAGNNYSHKLLSPTGEETEVQFSRPDLSREADQIARGARDLEDTLTKHMHRYAPFAVNMEAISQIPATLLSSDLSDPKHIENSVQTFCICLASLPNQDEQIQRDISAGTASLSETLCHAKKRIAEDPAALLLARLPRLLLQSCTADKIPDEVDAQLFASNPVETSAGMYNLCMATGLSKNKILELSSKSDEAERESHEDHYETLLSGGINEYWEQESYRIHFQIRDKLRVTISDGTYSPRLPPSERSVGFQWYLSFYSALQCHIGSASPPVVLLDNPALEVHVDGQVNIREYLQDKVSGFTQIMYVTHSPAMVDVSRLDQTRKVVLHPENVGTKVTTDVLGESDAFDTLEPVRAAIGSRVGYSLIASEFNVLVEGSSDKYFIEGALLRYSPQLARRVHVTASLSQSKDCHLAKVYMALRLPFIAVLDADNGGRLLARSLRKGGIGDSEIIDIGNELHFRPEDYALADLIPLDSYHEAVCSAHRGFLGAQPPELNRMIEKVYEELLRSALHIRLQRVDVARNVKQALIEGRCESRGLAELVEHIAVRFHGWASGSD